MTRIACVADLHENLPEIDPCDILIVAGDITYGFKGDLASQQGFLVNEFADWCRRVPAERIVVVAGNHDQCVERWGWPLEPSVCEYLQDSGTRLHGLNIWGTPWQPWFYGWAFNAPQRQGEEFLRDMFDRIPDDTDIVICHGPPYGACDQVGGRRAGSVALHEAVERVQPSLLVCGHIHGGNGMSKVGHTEVINAALVNDEYQPVNPLHYRDLCSTKPDVPLLPEQR